MRLVDISGETFGRLTVLSKHRLPAKNGGSIWICVCECGVFCVRNKSNLIAQRAKNMISSCGCKRKDWAMFMGADKSFIEKRVIKQKTHGEKSNGGATEEYKTWLRIKSRCYRVTDKDFPNWGGRGIAVCNRWKDSYESFLQDMGRKPSPRHTINRIDPNGDYCPENCQWVTQNENSARNRRDIIPVTAFGQTFDSIKSATLHFGVVKYSTVFHRIAILKWGIERALTEPADTRPNIPVTVAGKEFPSLSAAAANFKVKYTTVCYRINIRGMSVEQALTLRE